jgi:hypothetical protein
MMDAAAEKGAEGYMSFHAKDVVELPNGSLALLGKESIGKTVSLLDDKSNSLTWSPVHVDVSDPAIWATRLEITNSAPSAKTESPQSSTASTRPSGKSRKTGVGM